MTSPQSPMPDADTLKAANVNPVSGLATDYLNVFNEYIMLAELAADGSMEAEILMEWQPIDYESHFVQSGFAGVKTVLAAYRALDESARDRFDAEVNVLIDLVLDHQKQLPNPPDTLQEMQDHRDVVAGMISGKEAGTERHNDERQAEIDALFD